VASAIEQLLKTPPEKLLKELDQVRERERLIAHERELLERVLEILSEGGDRPAGWLDDSSDGPVTIGPLRHQIRRVMALGPDDVLWLPREVHAELVRHGNAKATLDNVRVTMRRMAETGELKKPFPKTAKYRLP
jgi:hypothetical protein